MPTFHRSHLKHAAICGLIALQPALQAASSLPSGGSFTAGFGNISASGNTLTINQSTLRGIINWNNFSIGAGSLVTFQNGAGATLNRVTGGAATTILGQLLASGNIYILNPEGILIGRGATVHTGGDFLASTLNLANNVFLSGGPLAFTGSSTATVVNLGNVSSVGGNIYLIGHSVDNAGSIASPNGTTGLATGSQVLISDTSNNQKVLVQAPGGDVTNSGFIAAAQVELKSNGGNIYALAGNNGGQIQATGTATQDGHVWLIANNGTANVSGLISATNANGSGGEIETSGAQLLTNGARIKTGPGGSWLLDPDDLTIDSVLAGTIETALNGGTNVTEQTTASGIGGSGDITVASNIAWATSADLTLSAYRNIVFDPSFSISNSSAGNLTLRADNASTGTGTINFSGSNQINFSGSTGNVSLLYNPSGYTTPTNYSSNVLTNGAWTAPLSSSQAYGSVSTQLTAYMLVNSLSELAAVSTNLAGTYGLGTDINANSAAFNVISGTFTGIFDGQGHVISNLPISSASANTGLFAGNGGVIRNVGLFNEVVNSSAVSGSTGGLVGQNSGIIFASYVNGLVNGPNAGGLAGQNSGTINNSYSAGAVNGGAAPSAGLAFTNSGTITDSYTAANAQNGLVSTSTGTVTNTYWDSTDTAATTSAAGTGYTRTNLQIAVPAGLINNPYWGGNDNQFNVPLFPYLAWQFPANTTPVAVYGNAYANQGQTPYVSAPVQGIVNGVNFGQTVYTGASGYYYFLLPGSMVAAASNVLTYLPTHGFAASFFDDFHGGDVAITSDTLPITNGYLTLTNKQYPTVLSSIVGDLSIAAGSTPNLPFTVTNGTLNLQSGTYLDLIGSGSNPISLDQAITINSLVLEDFGAVTQTAPLTVTNLSLLGPNSFTLTNSGNLISILATGPARGAQVIPTFVISPLDNVIPLSIAAGNLNVFSGTDLLLGSTDAASGVASVGTVTIQSSGSLTIASNIQVVSHNFQSMPISLVLADGTTFTNLAGSQALESENSISHDGTWQVWSQNPANDNRGAEAYDFKQYNAVYGTTDADQGTGNAFYYTLAPVLTPLIGAVTKQYDATVSAAGIGSYSLSGAVDGDSVSLLNTPSTGTFADKNVGSNKPITVTGLTVSAASNGEANVYGYSFNSTLVADVGTITSAPLTVPTSAVNKVYDGNTLTTGTLGSLSGVFESDVVSLQGTAVYNFATKNAGNEITVTASGLTLTGTDAGNYTLTPQTTTANITPAQLFYEPVATTRLYGSNNPVFAGTVGGLVGGDTLASVATGAAAFTSPATSASNVGTYAIDGLGLTLTGGNYILEQAEGNASALAITPALLTYTGSSVSRSYGSANPVFTGAVTGLVLGQTLASVATGSAIFTSPTTSASNVGTYAVNGSGLTLISANYTLQQAEGNASALSIAPALLTYTGSNVSRSYGSANPVFTGAVTGLVLGQTLASVATGSAIFTSPTTSASNVGTYAVNGSGLTLISANYTLQQAEGNASALSIAPALLTYNGSSASRTYGSANPVFTGAVTGLVLGQTLASVATGSAIFTSPTTSASNVGTYAVNGSGLTLISANYILQQAEGNGSALTITPATLSYLANSGITRTYGFSNPAFGGSVTGFVNGQTLASATTGSLLFSSPATIASPPGSYAINGSGLAANFGNYIFTQAPGNASAITITAAATPIPTPAPTPTPSPTTLTIAINNSTDLLGQIPSFTSTYSGVTPNGVNIPSLLTGLTYQITPALNGPGTYTITASGTVPAGYTLNILPGSLTVVAGSPTVLPSQVPVIATVLPVVLPLPPSIAANLLQPLNSLGLFQVDVTSTGIDVTSPFSFSDQGAQQPPLAQSSFFSGANDKKDTYAAGAKP